MHVHIILLIINYLALLIILYLALFIARLHLVTQSMVDNLLEYDQKKVQLKCNINMV